MCMTKIPSHDKSDGWLVGAWAGGQSSIPTYKIYMKILCKLR